MRKARGKSGFGSNVLKFAVLFDSDLKSMTRVSKTKKKNYVYFGDENLMKRFVRFFNLLIRS